jgi:hypothetical protein
VKFPHGAEPPGLWQLVQSSLIDAGWKVIGTWVKFTTFHAIGTWHCWQLLGPTCGTTLAWQDEHAGDAAPNSNVGWQAWHVAFWWAPLSGNDCGCVKVPDA